MNNCLEVQLRYICEDVTRFRPFSWFNPTQIFMAHNAWHDLLRASLSATGHPGCTRLTGSRWWNGRNGECFLACFELSLKAIPKPLLFPNILHELGTERNWWWCRISGTERPAGKFIEQSVDSHKASLSQGPVCKIPWPKHQQETFQCLTEEKK